MKLLAGSIAMKRFSSGASALALSLALLVVLSGRALAGLDLGFAKEDGGQPGAFLDFAASARSLAMGRAFTAVADDSSGAYWNPAGLTQLDRKDIVALYSSLWERTGYGFASYAQPSVDRGTFGVSFITLRSQNFERYDDKGTSEGAFDYSDTAIFLSHGIRLSTRWSIGENLKVIRQSIANYSDLAYGADLGLLYQPQTRFQMGFMLRNALAPAVQLKNAEETFPRQLVVGTKFQVSDKWLLAADVSKTERRGVKPSLGAEYRLNRVLALRAGLNEAEIDAGLGVQFNDWAIDYAFGYQDAVANFSDLGVSHRLGLHWRFGNRVSDQAASARWQKRGKTYLALLAARMNESGETSTEEIKKLLAGARLVIQHQGFVRPQDLYAAQGYIYFFEGEFERSVQSFVEALTLEPGDENLIRHREKAKARLTAERSREIVEFEMIRAKELFEKGDYRGAVKSCETVLSYRPDHVEAVAYLDDAKKRIYEPILRELKIAKVRFERGEYLDAIKHLQAVRDMDPGNKEAAEYMKNSLSALEKLANAQNQPRAAAEPSQVYVVQTDSHKGRELYLKGLMLYAQGKAREAVVAWKSAVDLDAGNEMARNAYNRALMDLKSTDRK